jgi:hypothetical protein
MTEDSGAAILEVTRSQETPLSPEVEDRIKQLLRDGQPIGATMLYRMKTDASLKEAKDAVDAIAESMGIAPLRDDEMTRRSCVASWARLLILFVLWVVVLLLVIYGLGHGARSILALSEVWVGLIQIMGAFLYVIVSVAILISWGAKQA